MNTLSLGSSGQLVIQLQQFLNCKGFFVSIDGIFGVQTKKNLMLYQSKSLLTVTGIADEKLIALITAPTILDKLCLAIKSREGFIAPCQTLKTGSPAWRNHNIGNIRFGEFARSHGAYTKDNKGFAVFSDYKTGYNALKTLLIYACTGQSTIYQPTMTILQFFQKYAPAQDSNDPVSYANEVSLKLGMSSDTIIKNLI